MPLDENNNDRTLGEIIAERITGSSDFRITFAEYMDWVLYHPQHGYYATASTKIGAMGDFFTAPHLGADFGELLAEQFVQMWQILEQPDRFTLVEMGAGQGVLATDILSHLQHHSSQLFTHLEYIIVERAATLINEQQRRLQLFVEQGASLRWCQLNEIVPASITGCFFSNELVDALPVHQVMLDAGTLKEVYVSLAADDRAQPPFVEVVGELSTPRLRDYFDFVGVDLTSPRYPDHYRTEVNLAALDWISQVADRLQRGYVMTIDYGYPSDRYYNPVRSEGTLQCYYHHRYHANPYLYIGQQDITAHVDFTALERQGALSGLKTVGFTKQGLFLMALGLGERIAALSRSTATDADTIGATLRRREALHTLIDPMRLGNFGVLIQSKGVKQERLNGLRGEVLP